MANPSAQVIFDFELGNLSWSEVYYWLTISGTIFAVIRDARLLATARRAWLGSNANLTAIRISEIQYDNEDFILGALFRNVPYVDIIYDGLGPGTNANGGAKYGEMVLFRFTNRVWGLKRSVMARGVPSVLWTYSPTNPYAPPIGPILETAIAEWKGQIDHTGGENTPRGLWCIKGVVRDPALNPKIKVVSVLAADTPPRPWQLTLAAPLEHTEEGGQIKVGGMRGYWSRGLNRICTIKTVAGNVITLHQEKGNDCPINYLGKGYVREQVQQLFPISAVDFVRFAVRDTGVSALAPKGKQRARRTSSRYY